MYSDMCKYILCNQYANIVMYDTQGTLPAVSCVIVHIGYPIGYEAGWIGWCCACLAQSLLNQFFILCYVFSFIFICFFVVKVGCFQKGLFQICLGDRLIVVVALQTRKMQQKHPPPSMAKVMKNCHFLETFSLDWSILPVVIVGKTRRRCRHVCAIFQACCAIFMPVDTQVLFFHFAVKLT